MSLPLACGDPATAPVPERALPAAALGAPQISVVPDPDRFCPFGCPGLQAGDSLQYAVRVEGANGRERFREHANWSSADERIATVSASGMVIGRAPGEVEITATVGTQTASTLVTVERARIATVAVTAASTQLQVGATTQLTATVTDVLGDPVTDASLFWFAATPTVVTVDQEGVATAVGSGDAIVMVFADFGRSAWVSLHVSGGPSAPALSVGSVDVGGTQACALTPAGSAYCWGWNYFGQLGNGAQGSELETFPTPLAVVGGYQFQSISAGDYHGCAVTGVGDAYCWGNGWDGQLGTGELGTGSPVAVKVAGDRSFATIAAGGDHTCALDQQGAAYCWGQGIQGQLGIGAPGAVALPSLVSGGLTFAGIYTGLSSTCALTADGTAYCWGSNESGQLGSGKVGLGVSAQTPVKVATHYSFATMDLRFSHACAATAAGEAYCWGRNDFGQLGDGTIESRARPTRVNTNVSFTRVAVGAHHSCALDADGRAYCWGNNEWGQLGDNTLTTRLTPAPIHGELRFTSLQAGNNVTCGTTAGGQAYCWGSSHYGALGNGQDGWDTISAVPVRVIAP